MGIRISDISRGEWDAQLQANNRGFEKTVLRARVATSLAIEIDNRVRNAEKNRAMANSKGIGFVAARAFVHGSGEASAIVRMGGKLQGGANYELRPPPGAASDARRNPSLMEFVVKECGSLKLGPCLTILALDPSY